MLYVAFAKVRPGHTAENFNDKSRRWWNDGECPEGLKMVVGVGTLGASPNVYVFEAEDHAVINKLVRYWDEIELDIHPAIDLIELYRAQGMQVR